MGNDISKLKDKTHKKVVVIHNKAGGFSVKADIAKGKVRLSGGLAFKVNGNGDLWSLNAKVVYGEYIL